MGGSIFEWTCFWLYLRIAVRSRSIASTVIPVTHTTWYVLAARWVYLNITEYREISWNIMMPWSALEGRLHILEYHGISSSIVESLGISWCHGLGSWLHVLEYHGISRNILEQRGVSVLENTENRRISRNIMERHEKSWCHGLPWQLTEYTGISLNIEEHDGMAYVVISCIAESPITPLGLASTTLGIFLYRRRGASAPEPPSPQKWEKGWPHQTTRGMSWNSAEYHDVTSGSVLEARCVY